MNLIKAIPLVLVFGCSTEPQEIINDTIINQKKKQEVIDISEIQEVKFYCVNFHSDIVYDKNDFEFIDTTITDRLSKEFYTEGGDETICTYYSFKIDTSYHVLLGNVFNYMDTLIVNDSDYVNFSDFMAKIGVLIVHGNNKIDTMWLNNQSILYRNGNVLKADTIGVLINNHLPNDFAGGKLRHLSVPSP